VAWGIECCLYMFALWLSFKSQRCGIRQIPPSKGSELFSFLSSRNHNPLNFATNSCRRIAATKSH
jgi:hypothetical protein